MVIQTIEVIEKSYFFLEQIIGFWKVYFSFFFSHIFTEKKLYLFRIGIKTSDQFTFSFVGNKEDSPKDFQTERFQQFLNFHSSNEL